MSAIIFAGPTLREDDIKAALPDAICRPPVAQGDVYRAVSLCPRAIGIIDGYFSGAPSVWHKEILWALAQGIHVYGSASMGALRAAELHEFGMQGVGRIFEAYRDGHIEDDDEVAVMHGPAEMGYVALSEPMASIRATIENAVLEGILSQDAGRALVSLAKTQFFGRRTWENLFELAPLAGIAAGEVAALRSALKDLRIDRKREDALQMLAAMREALREGEPFRAAFDFERTHFWDELAAREAECGKAAGGGTSAALVADELRLKGLAAYEPVEARAFARVLASIEDAAGLAPATTQQAREQLSQFRQEQGLTTRAVLEAWLQANRLTSEAMQRLMAEEARLAALRRRLRAGINEAITDELRLSGDYESLAARATTKLQSPRPSLISPQNQIPTSLQLRMWFFSHRIGMPMPHNLPDFVQRLGFPSLAAFDDALLREWTYVHNDAHPTDG